MVHPKEFNQYCSIKININNVVHIFTAQTCRTRIESDFERTTREMMSKLRNMISRNQLCARSDNTVTNITHTSEWTQTTVKLIMYNILIQNRSLLKNKS